MSEVEQYWEAIRAKWPHPIPKWHDLDGQKQHLVLASVNFLLQAIDKN